MKQKQKSIRKQTKSLVKKARKNAKKVKSIKKIIKKSTKPRKERVKLSLLSDEERKELALASQKRKEEQALRKKRAAEKEADILASIFEDKPAGYNLTGERGLIAAIFVQAMNDMLSCPHPNPNYKDIYNRKGEVKENPQAKSLCARQFIDAENPVFCHYCDLLDIDPEFFEKAFFDYFKAQLQRNNVKKLAREREKERLNQINVRGKVCSAHIVTILTHLLSELLTMIVATGYFVDVSVRDAA